MLTKIGIENFKAFGNYVELELDCLNIFSGLNSSGKTTIYQSLLLLYQSKKFHTNYDNNEVPTLTLNGDLVCLGKFEDVVNDTKKPYLRFCIEWNKKNHYDYYYKFHEDKKKFVLSNLTIKQEKASFQIKKNDNGSWTINAEEFLHFKDVIGYLIEGDIRIKYGDKYNIEDFLNPKVIFKNVKDVIFGDNFIDFFIPFEEIKETILPVYRDFIESKNYKKFSDSNYGVKIGTGDKISWFEEFFLFQPFRGYPERLYSPRTTPNPLKNYDEYEDKYFEYLYNFSNDSPLGGNLEKAIEHWVNYLNLAKSVKVIDVLKDLASELYIGMDDKDMSIINVGFGISQIMPIIFNLLAVKTKIFIIDEPEVHLHPSLQSKLAEFFLNMAMLGKQIFIETHSEYLIDKVIFLSLKYPNKKDKIKLYWVKKDKKCSYVEKISYDELGYLINHPDDFLSEKQKLVEEINKIRLEKLENE